MKKTAAFIMPVKLRGSEYDLRFFREAVDSIKSQTDTDWILIMVDDFSNEKRVYEVIDEFKAELKDKLHVIYSDKNYGAGSARNKGVVYASKFGAPFILFLDSDDIADSRRLELCRKVFEDDSVNVVYTSFDVINENDELTPYDEISLPVREIIDGHKVDIVEGEHAWIQIATKKKYTNLTSCTAVKTSLAVEEPFPNTSVSEDCHTWMRYGAHPGKFVFIQEIKGKYRICTGVQSRSRSQHTDFYEQMMKSDSDSFEQALIRAKRFGTTDGRDENELRAAFYVRLALNLLHSGVEEYCKKCLDKALSISKEKTIEYIDQLYCYPQDKYRLKEIIK